MKKVIIKNLQGIQTHGAEMEDPTAWIAECEASGAFGLPEEHTVEIIDITLEHELAECINKRVSEYPTPADFMNAFFDGGQVDLAELQARRLAIKAKYPKPV
jgi:hypothetical protein